MRTKSVIDVINFLRKVSETSLYKVTPEVSGTMKAQAFMLYSALRADVLADCPSLKLDEPQT